MFLKPFRVKTNTAIKGSDRKKLRAEVGRSFPALSQEQLVTLIPNKEEMTVMKISTHSELVVTVYCVHKNPVFFEAERTVFPTVYTLWKHPDALPALTTWPPVFRNISKGADLMLPGVIVNGDVTPQNLVKLEKGQVCSVKLLGNKAPVAVGRAAMSSSDMYASAMRGKGVVIVHSYQDALWAQGDKSHPPVIEDTEMLEAVRRKEAENDEETGEDSEMLEAVRRKEAENDEETGDDSEMLEAVRRKEAEDNEQARDDSEVSDAARRKEVEDNEEVRDDSEVSDAARRKEAEDAEQDSEGADSLSGQMDELHLSQGADGGRSDLVDRQTEEADEQGAEEDRQSGEASESEEGRTECAAEGDSRSPQERMDDLLVFCFKCALKSRVKKGDLPLLTSKFFKHCMQPFCPAGEVLDVRKSRDKKLGRFLQRMQQEGYVKVKELSRGVDSIVEYDRDHVGLRGLQVPDITEASAESDEASGSDVFAAPEIVEMYTLTAAVLPLFKELGMGKRKGDPVTLTELRQYVTDYVKAKELQNKSQVTLDAILAGIVLSKSEYLETLKWEELFSRVIDKLSPAYQYTVPGEQPVLKKGKVEPVTLRVQQRAGNKKVTTVTNLELFGINAQQFAQSVQRGVACSASATPLAGRTGVSEVIVQGNQVRYIATLLTEKYQLPRKYLQGAELAPKSGKKKR